MKNSVARVIRFTRSFFRSVTLVKTSDALAMWMDEYLELVRHDSGAVEFLYFFSLS